MDSERDKMAEASLPRGCGVRRPSRPADVPAGPTAGLTVATLKTLAASVGRQICARAEQEQADLVVMGAYGHSRLREFVFGGATRHVFTHMTVPTLFSH